MNTDPANHNSHLTHGPLLARNTVRNLVGSGAPLIVAVICVPILIRKLGTDRFGVLALAWALVGYAGLFDLGLGRALTQLIARKLGNGEDELVPQLTWTSLILLLLFGFLGMTAVAAVSPWLVHRWLNIPPGLQGEALRSFYVLAIAVPVVISSAALRGFLEAYQRFDLVNALRIPLGVSTFVGPILVLPFSRDLSWIVGVLVGARFVAWLVNMSFCLRVVPALRESIAWDRTSVGPLLRFGSWMTVSNVVGPLMVTLDRFVIGAMISVTAVAYYATPFEVATKFLLIPGAVVGVMFPAFSTTIVQDYKKAGNIFDRTLKYLLIFLFPLILATVVLASDGLRLWLGVEFAHQSTRILQWLSVGVFINSLSYIPFALIQGAGRPDLTAKLHLIELPLYLAGLWWLIHTMGLEGAAIAWTGRLLLDALVLFQMAKRVLPATAVSVHRIVVSLVPVLLLFLAAAHIEGLGVKLLFLPTVLVFFGLLIWFVLLTPEERTLARVYR